MQKLRNILKVYWVFAFGGVVNSILFGNSDAAIGGALVAFGGQAVTFIMVNWYVFVTSKKEEV